MEENESSKQQQKEKTKDNILNASSLKIDVENNEQQGAKIGTKVQDKKKTGILIALIATILVVSILGMTAYARYRSKIGGQGTAPVAAWSFKVNGSEEAIASFDLATTMSKTNGKVAEGVIAPGTSGSFDIEIDGSGSEVGIDYYITINAENMPTNLKLYKDANFTEEIGGKGQIAKVEGYIPLKEIETKVIEKIYWSWPYRTGETLEEQISNDKIDTSEQGSSCMMTIKVVGIQSNPNERELSQARNRNSKCKRRI